MGLTPSAVTRALRPLEGLGLVTTLRNERDARLVLASLTTAGGDLLGNAMDVIAEVMADTATMTPLVNTDRRRLIEMLGELARV